MLKVWVFGIFFLFLVNPALAAEKVFSGSWTWDGDESVIEGFRVKDQHNNVVIDTPQIPPSARTATGNVSVADGSCLSLYVVAVEKGGEESGNSNILHYCQPKPKLTVPAGVIITWEDFIDITKNQ